MGGGIMDNHHDKPVPEINHIETDDPICPHCGQIQDDWFDWSCLGSGGTSDCTNCGESFNYVIRQWIDYTFTTSIIECGSNDPSISVSELIKKNANKYLRDLVEFGESIDRVTDENIPE